MGKKKQLKQRIAALEQQVAELEAELAARPVETLRFVPYMPYTPLPNLPTTLPYEGWHRYPVWGGPIGTGNPPPIGDDYVWCGSTATVSNPDEGTPTQ